MYRLSSSTSSLRVLSDDWTSSPSSVDWHFLLVQHDLDLGSASEFKSLEAFKLGSFNLSENMVVGIELLRLVFVGMDTDLVMMRAIVLPLWDGLHVEQLHEVVQFDIVVLSSESLVMHEKSVFL